MSGAADHLRDKRVERLETQGLAYYRFTTMTVTHGIFTRQGGVSAAPWGSLNLGGNVGDDPLAVRENHRRMYAALAVDGSRACTVWQVHSADVVYASGPVPGRRWLAAADGLITDQPGTPLAMRFADCTPILAYDPRHGAIGMAHAGWRGTVQGMAAALVRAMTAAFGSRPADLIAGIGPSIGPAQYQVGDEVVAAVGSYFGSSDGLIARNPDDGTAYLDLWAANQRDLERAGVAQIEIAGLSTAETPQDFYSHRAEKGRTGRFGAVICL
jgi:YfiH family protein